jgi:pSer/pThr/pTyr-binding forkhead associated (FHA) protein
MNKFDRLETLAQRLIEGTFNRLFQTQLHPADPIHNADYDSSSPVLSAAKAPGEGRTDTRKALGGTPPNLAIRWLLQFGERQLRLGEPVVRIGRALDNDIILSDPSVSRYHAQLRWREGRYHLCPPSLPVNRVAWQGATQKLEEGVARTTVNHSPVAQKPLAPGDVIKLGKAILTVIVETGDT